MIKSRLSNFLKTRDAVFFAVKIMAVVAILCSLELSEMQAQVSCVGNVPEYNVDLTGQPGGVFVFPSLIRQGNCCGTTSPDRCLRFNITLDSGAAAVSFNIVSGAVPPGALFYQIDCGPQQAVGEATCLTGSGVLTFCKPGNNVNTYEVRSIPKPRFPFDDSVRVGCNSQLEILGFRDDSMFITSVFPGAPGAYDAYLSCTVGCSNPTFTPVSGGPTYVDYLISGYPIADQCGFNTRQSDTVRLYIYPELEVTVSPNPGSYCPTSSGVTLVASVNGGFGAYSYEWSNGTSIVGTSSNYTATAAGTYTVEVIDALTDCPVDTAVVPVYPANISLSLSAQNATCNSTANGTATVAVSGGTLPYTYLWSNGQTTSAISGLPAGSYSVTVTDAGGCANTNSVIITDPPTLTITLVSATNVGCNGEFTGAIDVDVNGGTLPYTYNWSSGETTPDLENIPAGTYTLDVTDTLGCTASFTQVITEPSTLDPLISGTTAVVNDVSCYGGSDGSVTLTVIGGTAPYTYLWSNSDTSATIINQPPGQLEVLIRDSNGCSAFLAVVINQPDSLVAEVLSISSFAGAYNVSCFGAANGEVDLAVSGGTPGYSYLWSNATVNEDLTNVGAGNYSVTVTDANGCTTSQSVTLTEPAQLAIDLSSPIAANGYNISCKGQNSGQIFSTVSGGAGPYTYTWSTGSQDTSLFGLFAGFYQLDITDANGCTTLDTITLTEPDTLVPLITATTVFGNLNLACNGDSSGVATVIVTGGVQPYSYVWSDGTTNDSIFSQPAGEIWVVVTDSNLCIGSDTANIIQPDLLEATVSVINLAQCNGAANGQIEASPFGGTPGYAFLWSTGDTTATLSSVPAGSYTIIVTDTNGCTFTATADITEPDPLVGTLTPFVYPSGDNVSCFGVSDGSIDVAVTGGTSPFSYLWNTADTTATLSGLSVGTYSVTITDANGCTDQQSITLGQPSQLVIDSIVSPQYPGGVNVTCNGGTNGSVNSWVSGGSVPYGYYWSNGDTTQNISGVSVFYYILTVTDLNGCVVADTSEFLTEPDILTTSVSSQTDVDCFGNASGSLTVAVTAGGTPGFQYSLDGVTFQYSPTFANLAAGTYAITVVDTNGCTAIQGASVAQPVAVLSATAGSVSPVSCYGGSTGSAVVTPAGGTTDYTYSLNGSSSVNDSTFLNLSAGNYSVTVTDANGCVATVGFLVTESPQLAGNITTAPAICTADNGSTTVSMIGGGGTYTYSWSPSGGSGSTANGLAAGNYSVLVTDNLGCTISLSTTVSLSNPTLASGITVSNATCFGYDDGSATLDPVTGGTAPFTYDWSNGNTASTATGLSAGTIAVDITDANGCELTLSATVSAPSLLAVSAGNDTLTCQSQAQLSASAGSGLAGSWSADIGPAFSDPSSQSSTVTGLNVGDNFLIWTVTDGVCFNSDTVNIARGSSDECELELPTAISPNGDSKNDGFEIKGLWIYPDNVFRVFNRWGNEVYSREDYRNTDWFGQNNDGEPLPDGTYFVIFEVVGKDIRRNTYVDLRR